MSYVGVPPFGQTVRTVTEVTAVQDQTVFYPTGGYTPGYIDIELDGSDLGSQDFTALDGVSVTLAVKCGAGDLFRSKAYWPVSLVDTYRKAEVDSLKVGKTGDETIAGIKTFSSAPVLSAGVKLSASGWSLTETGGVLYFAYNGVNKAKLDSSGNLTALANITAYGTV